jgi:prepilin peptidase CpaA
VVLVAALIAAVTDVWKFRIHNFITVPLLLSGLAYSYYHGGPTEFVLSLLGALAGFSMLIGFYALGGMGSGDVKMVAAMGAWLQLPWILYVVLAGALAAGAYALVLIAFNGRMQETWLNLQIVWHRVSRFGRYLAAEERVEDAVTADERRQRLIPFAAMLVVGIVALLVLAWFGLWD